MENQNYKRLLNSQTTISSGKKMKRDACLWLMLFTASLLLGITLACFYTLPQIQSGRYRSWNISILNLVSPGGLRTEFLVSEGEGFTDRTVAPNPDLTGQSQNRPGACHQAQKKLVYSKLKTDPNRPIHVKELNRFIIRNCNMANVELCQARVQGHTFVNKTDVLLEELQYSTWLTGVEAGGWWMPPDCSTEKNVAIVVPYRDRANHLAIFLRHLHPFLQRQRLHYRILVIEQVDDAAFNRGKLMNVGFAEALKVFPYDCFVFHDVDLLPEDDRNDYACPSSPLHMSVAVDKFGYKLLYYKLFGGVEAFSRDHFEVINGFSNVFWGWGAEDDNLFNRVRNKGLQVWRPPSTVARYSMLTHDDEEAKASPSRSKVLQQSAAYYDQDGLSNLKYRLISRKMQPLYTHIQVDLQKDQDELFGKFEMSR